jgi:glycosyltransferase involved in cell wall biosynthesis
VLHATPWLGRLTDRWIDLQARTCDRYSSRLLGAHLEPGATPQPHWLTTSARRDLRFAYSLMHVTRGVSPLWLAGQFPADTRPDVVHAHYGPPAALLLAFTGRLRRPLVVSFYGFDATTTEYVASRRWRRRYARLFAAAEAFVVEGPRMGERLEALGCPADKVHVARLPADAQGLEGIERAPAPVFRAVLAGRFIEKKGFDTAIRAFGRAFADRDDAELLIIGGGAADWSSASSWRRSPRPTWRCTRAARRRTATARGERR